MEWQLLVILVLQTLLGAMTFASFIPIPDGAVRVCDVPRAQIAIAAAVLGMVAIAAGLQPAALATVAAMMGLLVVIVQSRLILPYTAIWPKESRWAKVSQDENTVSVLVSNVLQSNTHYEKLARLIADEAPDIILVMEVDQAWLDGIADATNSYKWRLEEPLDNLYGIAVYSKLRLINAELMHILRDDIPSISAICELKGGKQVRLIAVHPEPPLPHEMTEERDAEIIVAGQMALDDPRPAIVTGDLNDVAWSRTTLRFRRMSGLLDPRIGRGMYNTFNANWPLLRWPLDHLFHDGRFSLVSMRRLGHIGSDHFPIFFELALNKQLADNDVLPDPSDEDIIEAEELLDSAGLSKSKTLAPVKAHIND